ncbi:MAG: hypothetical protein HYW02_06465 [Deltaproteobacteria bacterium]|nr:hypothetical protein [Deltaproteobacteria bacterium]MBI2501094.1 hypothetical protein [Deltaproteobacteria bacterium]
MFMVGLKLARTGAYPVRTSLPLPLAQIAIDDSLAQEIHKGLKALENGSKWPSLFSPIKKFWEEHPRISSIVLFYGVLRLFELFWGDISTPIYTDHIKPHLAFCLDYWGLLEYFPSFQDYNAKSPYKNLNRQQHFIDQSDLREKEILGRQKALEKKIEDLNQTLERGHSCKHVTSQQ